MNSLLACDGFQIWIIKPAPITVVSNAFTCECYSADSMVVELSMTWVSASSDSESTQSKSPAWVFGILVLADLELLFEKNYLLQAGLLGAYADTKLTNFPDIENFTMTTLPSHSFAKTPITLESF